MDIAAIIVWFVTVLAIGDGANIGGNYRRPMRRLVARRMNAGGYSVPKNSAGSPGGAKQKLSNNLNIRNLQLAPGQAKVIRSTLVVRRRGPAKKATGNQGKPKGAPRRNTNKNVRASRGPLVLIRPTHLPGQLTHGQFVSGTANPRAASTTPHRAGAGFTSGHGHAARGPLASLNLPVISVSQLGSMFQPGHAGGSVGAAHTGSAGPISGSHGIGSMSGFGTGSPYGAHGSKGVQKSHGSRHGAAATGSRHSGTGVSGLQTIDVYITDNAAANGAKSHAPHTSHGGSAYMSHGSPSPSHGLAHGSTHASQPLVSGGSAYNGKPSSHHIQTGIIPHTGQHFVRVHLGSGKEVLYTSGGNGAAVGAASVHQAQPHPTAWSRTRRTTMPSAMRIAPTTLKAGEDPPEGGANGGEVEI